MFTVIEHPNFQRQVSKIWSDAELAEFIWFIVQNPFAGKVIPGAGGARKIRWAMEGQGKRGAARVIYFNLLENGMIELFAIYEKSEKENMTAAEIKNARKK